MFDAQAGGLICTACGAVVDELQVLGRDDEAGTSAGRGSFRRGAESLQSRQARLVAAQTDNQVNRGDYARRKETEWDFWLRGVLHACALGALLETVQLKFRNCRAFAATKHLEQHDKDVHGEFVPEHERVGVITWGRQAEVYGLGCAYIVAVQAKSGLTLAQLLSRADRPSTDRATVERAIVAICRWVGPAEVEFGPELLLDRIHTYTYNTLQLKKPDLLGSAHAEWNKGSLKWARAADLKQAKAFADNVVALGRAVSLSKGREPGQVAVAAFVMGMEAVQRAKSPSLTDWFDHLGHAFGGKAFTIAERYREFESFLLAKSQDYPFLIPAPSGKRNKKPELIPFAAILVKVLATNSTKEGTYDLQHAAVQPASFPDSLSSPDAADSPDATDDSAEREHANLAPSTTPAERPSAVYDTRRTDRHGKRPVQYMRERAGPIKRSRLLDEIVGGRSDEPGSQSPTQSEHSPSSSGKRAGPSRRVKVVLPHEAEAEEMVRQLLQGHDPTAVLEGKAKLEERSVNRLEKLIIARGGHLSGHEFDGLIDDDELFDDGELDSLLRTEDEANMLRGTARWRDIEANHKDFVPSLKQPVKRTRGAAALGRVATAPRSKVTAAMKAFAEQLLKGDEEGGEQVAPDFGAFQAAAAEDEDEDEDEDEEEGEAGGGGLDGETMAHYDQIRSLYAAGAQGGETEYDG